MNKIDHPEHYLRALFGYEVGYEAVKNLYRFRAGRKEGETKQEDIKKAEWYEDYLIKLCTNYNFFEPIQLNP